MNLDNLLHLEDQYEGGHHITRVTDQNNRELPYTINQTMMRIDLAQPLKKGMTFAFKISWWYNINNTKEVRARSGYEKFSDGHNVYCMAQFFPRLCKYYDTYGWQNKQYMGRGEFTLDFGNYNVQITVPEDHLVAATGTLVNGAAVLTKDQLSRIDKAKNSFSQPITIATLEDADYRIKNSNTSSQKTWKFKAENVRDFAFASSRRFIWDAMNTTLEDGKTAMAMSMWTKEGNCLWSKFSSKGNSTYLKMVFSLHRQLSLSCSLVRGRKYGHGVPHD